ncbi:Hypothetical predicted protein, partial [Paramuricea clavata]
KTTKKPVSLLVILHPLNNLVGDGWQQFPERTHDNGHHQHFWKLQNKQFQKKNPKLNNVNATPLLYDPFQISSSFNKPIPYVYAVVYRIICDDKVIKWKLYGPLLEIEWILIIHNNCIFPYQGYSIEIRPLLNSWGFEKAQVVFKSMHAEVYIILHFAKNHFKYVSTCLD